MGRDLDSTLLQGQEDTASASRQLREEQNQARNSNEPTGENTEEPQNWRQKLTQVRKAMNVKEEVEKKVATPVSMLKTKLLNLIPGYGSYVVFQQAVLMKKNKFTLVDVIIMLFSNLSTIFIILIVIATFFMLIDLVTGWFGWVVDLVS